MDIELIHKLGKDNVVPNMLTQKKKYQDEKVINVTQALRAMLIGESDLDRRLKENYVNDHLAQHYFEGLRHKHKMRGIYLKDKLLKWKQS
jgi:ribosomal protein S13